MNKKQKIMVIIVGIVCLLLITKFIYSNFFESDITKSEVKSNNLEFEIPVAESTNVKDISKLDYYQSLVPKGNEDNVDKLDFNEESINEINIDSLLKEIEDPYDNIENLNTLDQDTSWVSEQDDSNSNIEEDIYSSNTINQPQIDNMPIHEYNQREGLNDLLKSLNIYSAEKNEVNVEPTITEDKKEIVATQVSNEYESKLDSLISNAFYDTNNSGEFNSSKKDAVTKEFIHAEFYRSTVLRQGDIVEIRILEDLVIFENYFVPKGTILYGITAISPRRLFINLTKNIYKNNSVSKQLLIHDFDGREGVYLEEQGLYKIPAEITSELTEIIKSQYSQPSFGGINNNVELDKIALITGFDKIYEQINQLTVKVSGGYKLWIKI